ncbi:hypothetical protein [Afipia felis]|jgi:hypothetical protein|uniref:Uncharacterized protein n=2 Tax=Afipia felis TaxID=1035 RepID=A0A380W6Q6_AFIFE|nr:hypothetical protein [Afipia felis]EKS30986.1 hypothetical protein HMPREF9697_03514 [Afipia felis ATCC 53690]SUU75730.1 Uncharacterised protein [Afipia felis]SUU83797.1 Uncharacterised protein [Afipia felis]
MAVVEDNHVGETLDLMGRLQVVLTRMDLDCNCREILSEALERFSDLESRRLSRRSLLRARDHKDRIDALLMLLSDLDQLTENEKDRTVFVEMALLFEEIGRSAEAGAAALRSIDPQNLNCRRDDLARAVSVLRR